MATTKTILIIDDDKPVRTVLKTILENHGYHVTAVSNSTDGLALLQSETFHLIITDLIMPDPDGFETMREIKARIPDTKIIAMSGHFENDPEKYKEVLKSYGADAVIRKPVDNEQIIAKIEQTLI